MRHQLDFTIYEDYSKDTIIFVDKSCYYEYPKNPILEVTFPVDEVYSQLIVPNQVNVLDTQKLCYNNDKVDFPDGVYKFRYSVAPNDKLYKEINYLKTTKLTLKLVDLLKQDLTEDFINKIYKVDLLIRAGEQVVKEDVTKASEFYNTANKLIKKLECNDSNM